MGRNVVVETQDNEPESNSTDNNNALTKPVRDVENTRVLWDVENTRVLWDVENIRVLLPPENNSTCLLSATDLPPPMREPYIVSHYRHLHKPHIFYLRSIFSLHNETCNIWSHLLPSIFVISRAVYIAIKYDLMNDITLWPLIATYMGTLSTLLLSVIAHTFGSRSSLDHCFFFQLDYLGIAIYLQSIGTGMHFLASTSEYYEVFGSAPLYVGWVSAAVMTVVFCSVNPRINPFYKQLLLLFFVFSTMVLNIVPVIYRLHNYTQGAHDPLIIKGHLTAQVLGVISTLFYGSHFPERCSPGRFDIFGQSHTIFHIILFIGQFVGVETGVIEFKSRDLETRLMGSPSVLSGIGGFLLVGISGLITLLVTRTLRKRRVLSQDSQ